MAAKQKNEWLEWGKAILVAVVLAFIIRNFLFATSIVEGASMDPTLENGERVVFNKVVYHLDEPEFNDIVIIERPEKSYVKRVIGEPGDTVEVKNHELFVNGEKQKQNYLDQSSIQATRDYGPIKVPDGKYFVMGDNRAVSKDSRNGLGMIEEEEIIGRTELVIFPFGEAERTE
ncbi:MULTISPECIES: signal peptidase I [Salimicrobium]|uniref:Signal peptidase I n=4 Tax=Salimicrobium TaxID=351195 RepID=K2FLC7_9BACI|nr:MULTISPECIES: signal peptidase I [Salimicrobium]AKG04713.1 signal peptidase I [Salimicrobium jeotgali]EKE31786.1 signal peptidase I [Salimicrobium jeotgali]MBM7696252.1 signal peptidase I [Salimicrobium jeotgali]PBB05168.1 signal peptidase I [Salimicrobium humidisoli]SDX35945.1 signal peptidase I [Salimicrobium album]